MKFLQKIPLWLWCGLLHGFSWPLFEHPNLSFLAWFAFVPLLVFLERNKDSFWRFLGGGYGAMFVFSCLAAGWLFNFPESTLEVGVIFLTGTIYMSIVYLPFYFLQKKLSFQKAVWLFPFLWVIWEWVYLPLEFTMGTHLLSYTQSSNTWLIQYVDLTGMWGISFWVILFNVLIWQAGRPLGFDLRSGLFRRRLAKISLGMLAIPLLYAAYVFHQYANMPGESATVSLIPTQYTADFLMNPNNQKAVVEETLMRTDSLAYTRLQAGQHTDLYLWPETGANYPLDFSNLGALLQEATTDWEAALITGCKGVPADYSEENLRTYVSGVLISGEDKDLQYHHKTILTPGQESIPYEQWLRKIPGFDKLDLLSSFRKKGTTAEPLTLSTIDGRTFKVGVSLCFEQWYPSYWAETARNGADFFVHLAGEGWYGRVGFQQYMANVSRLRCIENRHSLARCANIGHSLFIDPLGRFYDPVELGAWSSATAAVKASSVVSFYARFPWLFPVVCLVGLTIGSLLRWDYAKISTPVFPTRKKILA